MATEAVFGVASPHGSRHARIGTGQSWQSWQSRQRKVHGASEIAALRKYRWAVATLRELQRSFTSELCDAVAELMRLVVWRDEMGRKVLCNFCTKLHQAHFANRLFCIFYCSKLMADPAGADGSIYCFLEAKGAPLVALLHFAMWQALFGKKTPDNEHTIQVRFTPGWNSASIEQRSMQMPSKWTEDTEEWLNVSSMAWHGIIRTIEEALYCEETKAIQKKIRCRGCVIILSLIGLVLGFMCGFLMSFLGCLDGDAGVCATGLTFAVIFVISLVSLVASFLSMNCLLPAYARLVLDKLEPQMPQLQAANPNMRLDLMNINLQGAAQFDLRVRLKSRKECEEQRTNEKPISERLPDAEAQAGDVCTRQPLGGFAKRLDPKVNEFYLMHGTSPDGALGITDGNGAYFAECSSKADEYSSAGEGIYEGVYAMLLCRVACGQMLRMLRPDPQMVEHAIGKVASAVLGDREASVGTYREFVVFDASQIYPEYVEISGVNIGRMIFKLYDNICPKTAENFRCLCNGERGTGLITKMPLNFQGSKFHRVIPGFMAQAQSMELLVYLGVQYHYLVPEWMKTASDAEKRGVIKLARIAEPKLLKTIGRPRSDAFEPMLKEHPWFHKRGNPVLEQRVDVIEKFPVDASEYQVPSWMNDDLYEAEQIPKPGGCILKLKDSINIMRQKNWTRNQGTYQMFSGSFDGATTTGSCYTREAIGLAPMTQPE
eukprot:s436_g34.t1